MTLGWLMSGWIIVVGADRRDTWVTAIRHGVWASPRSVKVTEGDDLFFWVSREGLIATATAADDSRPVSGDELPWADQAGVRNRSWWPIADVHQLDRALVPVWSEL